VSGFACPTCGQDANLGTSTSTFRTPQMVLRGRRCPKGHMFLTMEVAIDRSDLMKTKEEDR